MTDRELIELAAKAAGWTWWRSKHGYWNLTAPDGRQHDACHNWPAFDASTGEKLAEPTVYDALIEVGFVPLTDDGDAVRLAVKLKLDVFFHPSYVEAHIAGGRNPPIHHIARELYDADPYAATRRAITKAAAEIGRE